MPSPLSLTPPRLPPFPPGHPPASVNCFFFISTRLFLGQWSHVTAVAKGGSSRYRTDYFTEILEYEDRGKRKDSLKRVMEALMMDVVALVTVLGTGGGEADMQEALSAVEGAWFCQLGALAGGVRTKSPVDFPTPPQIHLLKLTHTFSFSTLLPPHLVSPRRPGGLSGVRVPEHASPVRAPAQCGV